MMCVWWQVFNIDKAPVISLVCFIKFDWAVRYFSDEQIMRIFFMTMFFFCDSITTAKGSQQGGGTKHQPVTLRQTNIAMGKWTL